MRRTVLIVWLSTAACGVAADVPKPDEHDATLRADGERHLAAREREVELLERGLHFDLALLLRLIRLPY